LNLGKIFRPNHVKCCNYKQGKTLLGCSTQSFRDEALLTNVRERKGISVPALQIRQKVVKFCKNTLETIGEKSAKFEYSRVC
jgi:hypothetical protein